MTNALIYVRISQDREGAGLGVERQREDCEKKAADLGWTVVGVYEDNDVSAYSGKRRKGYRAMLADLTAGKATAVIAWHTDRLHRSMAELEEYITICETNNVVTQTVQAGNLDLATAGGRMIARQLGAVARYESEHKGERIRRAALQRAEQGRYGGGTRAYGFKKDGVTLEPEEAKLIKSATETILAGGSLRQVVKEWNDAAMFTPKGRRWQPVEVRGVLMRVRNCGASAYKGEILKRDAWEAIVTEDQWRSAVQILTDPTRRTTPGNKIRWLGSYIYRCECGDVMICTMVSRGGTRKPTYRCRENAGTGEVHTARVAESIDRYISAVVVERLSRPDAAEAFVMADSVDTVALNAELTAVRNRLTELTDLFADGVLDVSQLASGTQRLKARQAEIEDVMAHAAVTNPLSAIVFAEDVSAAWEELPLDTQRAIIRTLMTVTVHPSRRGRPPGFTKDMEGKPGGYFDPAAIEINWLNETGAEDATE